jgi:endonuclease-3
MGAEAAPRSLRTESFAERKRRARRLVAGLATAYPDARCALEFRSPWELLVATVLSAQSTDAQVNRTTPALFREFPTPAALAGAPRERIESLIRRLGMFRRKAESLQRLAHAVHHEHGGEVPHSLEALVCLSGVGRKTANVILGTAFGEPAITVDTHVGRLSRRMGLSDATDPAKVEQDLCALLAPADWTLFCHRMIHHGRQVCAARRPACSGCAVRSLCPRVDV